MRKEQPNQIQKLQVTLREQMYRSSAFLTFKQDAPGAAARTHLDVTPEIRDGIEGMLVEMTTTVLGNAQRREVTAIALTPKTWWDHLKLTLRTSLPHWLVKRLHIDYQEIERTLTITEVRICPHLPYANRQDHDRFLAFIDPMPSATADGIHLRDESVPPIFCLVGKPSKVKGIAAHDITTRFGGIVVDADSDRTVDRAKVAMATHVVVIGDPKEQPYDIRELLHYAAGLRKDVSEYQEED